jgi:hypothetical protein
VFHGHSGVVPLADKPLKAHGDEERECAIKNMSFHPLAASSAAISLSMLGAFDPFGFDAFMSKQSAMKKNKKTQRPGDKQKQEKKPTASNHVHEALGNEWLQTGNCPIAKSFRAVSGVLPLVAKVLQTSPDMKLKCPPAIVAARAALARTAAVKSLRPQPLPTRVLAVGMLGLALNVPLGIWREHTKKFSPAWFAAVHASVPFIAMLRKAVHMPKYVMAFTFAASILGQTIGSRAERQRLAKLSSMQGAVDNSSDSEVMGASTIHPIDRKDSSVLYSERDSGVHESASSSPQLLCPKEAGNAWMRSELSFDPLRVF